MQTVHAVSIARWMQPKAVARLICETAKPWSGIIYDRFADGRLLRVVCRRGKPVRFSVRPASTPAPKRT